MILKQKPIKYNRKFFKAGLPVLIMSVIIILIPDWLVNISTKKYTYNSVHLISFNRVGLLLGTTKLLHSGELNLYYKYRIDAAVELFNSGKIDFILVSGDNRRRSYNEPVTIKNDLIARGIPESKIFLDYAGFRTLDSIIRAKQIFEQDSITVISQRFHNERAIFIARRKGLIAIGFNAKDVDLYYGFKTMVRELLARDKMVLDLILNRKSEFLGERIQIK